MPASPSLLIVPARFKAGKLYTQIATTSAGVVLASSGDFNVTRATTATRFNSAGLIESVASGVPRLDYYTSGGTAGCPALLVEPSAVNLALHSRDLSNVVWVKTSITAAKNAVGADGTVSGSTTLTATAASGTVLQALVNVSQSRVFSAYIRRVSGTGAIQLTTNGGTNWDTVTISSLYTQVACTAQTVASGSVGIRMAVSGDVIEVDFTQGEVGPVATSPIATTTGSVTRNADVISLSGAVSGCIGQTEGTVYLEMQADASGTGQNFLYVGNNANDSIVIGKSGANCFFELKVSGTTLISTNVGLSGTVIKGAIAYANSNYAAYANGNLLASGTTSRTPANPLTVLAFSNFVNLPTINAPSAIMRIRAAALYTSRLTNAELAALTTL